MRRWKRWLAGALCALLAAGVGAAQLVPAVARGECTCEIAVHGSNCPLSQCTCEGKNTGEHTEACPLYSFAPELTECICQPDIHGEGCPWYVPEDPEASPVENAGSEEAGSEEAGSEEAGEETGPSAEPTEPAEQPSGEPAAEPSQEPVESGEPTQPSQEPAASAEPSEEPVVSEEPAESEDPESSGEPTQEPEWEYPSPWEGYGEGQMQGNLALAAEAFTLDRMLEEHIQEIRGVLTGGSQAQVRQDGDNFGDVAAVYAVLTGQAEDYPYGLALDSQEAVNELRGVYWSMTQVTGVSNQKGAAISVRRLDVLEGAAFYGFTPEQTRQAQELAGQSGLVEELVSESIFASLTPEEFAWVLEQVPEEVEGPRRAVLLAAASLVGKVDYFWGGRSLAYGWDDRWGETRTVTSPGSSSYGTARPLGLDCAGFVSWAFLNAGAGDEPDGTAWEDSEEIAWEQALPGEVISYYEPGSGQDNHVGLVLSVGEDGPELVIHCAPGNGVAIAGAEGFGHVRRPAVFAG